MDHPRLLVTALRLLLRRHHELLHPAEHADESVWSGRTAGAERQPAIDPAAGRAEPADPRPVPAAGRDDAHLLGGAKVWNDRAAPHIAADGFPEHHGEVSRRDGALRHDARRHADSHRAAVRLRPARVETDRDGLSGAAAAGRLLYFRR